MQIWRFIYDLSSDGQGYSTLLLDVHADAAEHVFDDTATRCFIRTGEHKCVCTHCKTTQSSEAYKGPNMWLWRQQSNFQTLFPSLIKGINLVRDSGLDVWTRLVVWRSKAVTVDRGVGDYCGYETSPGLNEFETEIWLMLQAELATLWGAAEDPGELKRAMLGWPELKGIQCKAVARRQPGAILKSFPGVRAWNRWCDQRAVAQEKQGGYID